jgi:hypothetical protein
MRAGGQTKLMVAFLNYANAPKNLLWEMQTFAHEATPPPPAPPKMRVKYFSTCMCQRTYIHTTIHNFFKVKLTDVWESLTYASTL